MNRARVFAIGVLSIVLSGCVLVVGTDNDKKAKANSDAATEIVKIKVAASTLSADMAKCPEGTTTVTEDVSRENGKTVATIVCTKTAAKDSASTSDSNAEILQALVLARTKLASDTNLPIASRQRAIEALDEQIARLKVYDKK